jgi:hypothetical protein
LEYDPDFDPLQTQAAAKGYRAAGDIRRPNIEDKI